MRQSRNATGLLLIVSALISGGCGGKTSAGSAPATPAPVAAVPTTPGDTLPSSVTPAMAEAGRALFNEGSCSKCHGPNGAGGDYGPNLTDTKWVQMNGTYADILDVITFGVPASKQKLATSNPQFAMRARGGMNYSDEDIRRLAAYIWTASHTPKRK